MEPVSVVHPTLASSSLKPVGARMVLLFDVSYSVDDLELQAQTEAMSEAIGSEDFKNAIFYPGGPGSIAICVAEFHDEAKLRIGWVDVRKGEEYKLKQLAKEVADLERVDGGSTSQVYALRLARKLLKEAPWEGESNKVCLITDGKENVYHKNREDSELLHEEVSELAEKYGATVNAFITETRSESDLKEWSEENLITKDKHLREKDNPVDPGFVMVVATQNSAKNPGAMVKYINAMRLALRSTIIKVISCLEPVNRNSPARGRRIEAQIPEIPIV
jgi:hypothetical protein